MPVVVNMAHEAKPHLAGLSLMLLAIVAACRYVETGKTRRWAVAGALCGAAFGMVISSRIVFIILPVMTLLRPMRWVERISVSMMAIGVGFLVYAITNPCEAGLVARAQGLRSACAQKPGGWSSRRVRGQDWGRCSSLVPARRWASACRAPRGLPLRERIAQARASFESRGRTDFSARCRSRASIRSVEMIRS
jgi:hypothetical protein